MTIFGDALRALIRWSGLVCWWRDRHSDVFGYDSDGLPISVCVVCSRVKH